MAQDRNALDRDLSHLPGEAADSQSGSSGLDGTYFLPAVNSFKSSWWMPFFVKLLIALLLAITSGRDCGDTITGPGKDLGKITRVYENVPSSAPAESFFPEWRGSYSALCSRPFFSIGAAYASPQGEPNQKKKVTEKELPLPANLQVSKRIAFPDPIFGQVTFQCPPDYDLLFNQCQKKVVRPPMVRTTKQVSGKKRFGVKKLLLHRDGQPVSLAAAAVRPIMYSRETVRARFLRACVQLRQRRPVCSRVPDSSDAMPRRRRCIARDVCLFPLGSVSLRVCMSGQETCAAEVRLVYEPLQTPLPGVVLVPSATAVRSFAAATPALKGKRPRGRAFMPSAE